MDAWEIAFREKSLRRARRSRRNRTVATLVGLAGIGLFLAGAMWLAN
jgi:hypothetical protein